MINHNSTAIILAAGLGTRMKSNKPKVMHNIAGRPMIKLLISTLLDAGIKKILVVIGKDMKDLSSAVHPHQTIIQNKILGTGHAALEAAKTIKNFDGNLIIFNGDNPMISPQSIHDLERTLEKNTHTKITILGFHSKKPGSYGRIILNSNGNLERIVESRDASPDELSVNLCSSGIMAIDGTVALSLLKKIDKNNSQNEYYLSDIIKIAKSAGLTCSMVEGQEAQLLGINSRQELAKAELACQTQLRFNAMAEGATLIDPKTVWFSWDTKLGQDVIIEPNVFFGPSVEIGDNVQIKSFCHIEGTKIAANAIIGPFARLRPGTIIESKTKVGNFVEVKNSIVGENAKVNHLSYIGDATIGTAANVGAGTITCNFNGIFKSQTFIGEGALIGSNTSLVAPVNIGARAIVGAGSVITQNIEPEALAIERTALKQIKGGGRRLRKRLASKRIGVKR